MQRHTRALFIGLILIFSFMILPLVCSADYYSYEGQVSHDVKRDRIIAICEDNATLEYYISSANITPSCSGTTPPD